MNIEYDENIIIDECGVDFRRCILCGVCASGCQVDKYIDYKPHEIAYLIRIGKLDRVLDSKAIEYCLTCYLCEERCPKGVELTRLYIYLNNLRARIMGPDKISKSILNMILNWGRVDEVKLVRRMWGLWRSMKTVLKTPQFVKIALGGKREKICLDEIESLYKYSKERVI